MITIHDLLKDPKYKEFFCQIPELPEHMTWNPESKPWRLYVKLKGEGHWRAKDYHTYKEAFLKLKRILPRVNDAAITSKAKPFDPPHRVVRVKGKFQMNKQNQFVLDKQGNKKPITKLVFWKPQMSPDEFEEHHWCPYCRRPTVFKYFLTHHALTPRKLGGMGIDPSLKRCLICGSSERIVNLRGHL